MREAILILQDVDTGTYHAALFAEAPFPGDAIPDVVRLRSRAHHTKGAPTLEGAQRHADELATHRPSAKLFRNRVEAFCAAEPACHVLLSRAELD